MIQASLLRAGMCIVHEKDICRVMSVTHRTPGNLRAFVQVRMRNLRVGNSFDYRFSSTEGVERAMLDTHPMDTSARSLGPPLHEPGHVRAGRAHRRDLGDSCSTCCNMVLTVDFHDENPVGVELPNTVTLTVVDTEPGMKNATASASYKPAKMETGLVVNVPQFISNGDRLVIDTRETKYLNRA